MITAALMMMLPAPEYAASHAALGEQVAVAQAGWIRCSGDRLIDLVPAPDSAETVASAAITLCDKQGAELRALSPEFIALGMTDKMTLFGARRAVNSTENSAWSERISRMRAVLASQVVFRRAALASSKSGQ